MLLTKKPVMNPNLAPIHHPIQPKTIMPTKIQSLFISYPTQMTSNNYYTVCIKWETIFVARRPWLKYRFFAEFTLERSEGLRTTSVKSVANSIPFLAISTILFLLLTRIKNYLHVGNHPGSVISRPGLQRASLVCPLSSVLRPLSSYFEHRVSTLSKYCAREKIFSNKSNTKL